MCIEILAQKHIFQPEIGANVYIDRSYFFEDKSTNFSIKGKPSGSFHFGMNYSYSFHSIFNCNVGLFSSFVPYSHFLQYSINDDSGESITMRTKSRFFVDGINLKIPIGLSAEIPIKVNHVFQLGVYYVNQFYHLHGTDLDETLWHRYDNGSEVVVYRFERSRSQIYQGFAKIKFGYGYRLKSKNYVHFYLAFEPEITKDKVHQKFEIWPETANKNTYTVLTQMNHNLQFGIGYSFIK